MRKFVIMGAQGCGKGTQAKRLKQELDLIHICVGDIFRWHIQSHTKLGARIKRLIAAGQMVDDETVEEIIRGRLAQHDWNFGFILDGFPRTRTQAEFFLESYDIDAVIQTDLFEGDIATLGTQVNDLVNAHILMKKRALAVFEAFGEGNFQADIEQLPGKKAFINDTVEKMRANLKGFLAEMNKMSTEHDKGDIDVQFEPDKFLGAFKAMAQGVNRMVTGHIAVKKKAMACVAEFGKGNFKALFKSLERDQIRRGAIETRS